MLLLHIFFYKASADMERELLWLLGDEVDLEKEGLTGRTTLCGAWLLTPFLMTDIGRRQFSKSTRQKVNVSCNGAWWVDGGTTWCGVWVC